MVLRILILVFLLIEQVHAGDIVIAEFGKNKITLEEFKAGYFELIKMPDVFDSKKLRENYLNEMITERILAAEAVKKSFDDDEVFKYRIDAYYNKCLRDEHFKSVIKPQIKITEKDVEEVYTYTQEERRISHLFCINEKSADSLYQLLQNGVPFEALAKGVFKDTSLANSGGDLGYVNWDQLDYDLAMQAFRMSLNSYSKPVKSQFGYHIIKITGFRKKPLITRSEYELHKRKVRYLLEYKIGDKLAFGYLGEMLNKTRIKVFPPSVNMIHNKLSGLFKRKPAQFDQSKQIQLNEQEVRQVETNLWESRNQELALIDGSPLTIGDFIGYLSFVPYQITSGNFKQTLDYVFRDFLITKEAKNMKLEDSAEVKIKTNLFRESLLEMNLRRDLVSKVTVKEDDLKNYYTEHKKDFKDTGYDQARDVIRNLVLTTKKEDAVPAYVKKLVRGIKITKNLSALHQYLDSILAR